MAENPPPLVSPILNMDVRAVLDQDAYVRAGLAIATGGQRAVLLVGSVTRPELRDEFLAWGDALTEVGSVARVAPIADFGYTAQGSAYLATYVQHSLADHLRLVGQPDPARVRGIGATVADALAAAHARGIAHAAVSPATVLLDDDGARLGGFGATAPGLTGPLGIWAFTAPEHRAAAAAGDAVFSPAADVFALAATICVALAGVLPWSDPATWADAADLPPTGPDAPTWVWAVRAGLSSDPDERPTAREFAGALRAPAEHLPASFHGAKTDLRGLIPRAVRRLSAYSIEAMADGGPQAVGRAVPTTAPAGRAGIYTAGTGAEVSMVGVVEPKRHGRLGSAIRAHRVLTGAAAALVVVLLIIGGYALTHGTAAPAAGPVVVDPAASASGAAIQTLALLNGAREASQVFLHKLGTRDRTACTGVHGSKIATTSASTTPITCPTLIAHASTLIGTKALTAMRTAVVGQAVGFSDGTVSGAGGFGGDPDPHAFVSLPYVPDLVGTLNQFEMVLTYHDGRWYVVQVTFG